MDDNFHGEFADYCDYLDGALDEHEEVDTDESYWDEVDPWEAMDGDHESGLASAGWGTDEDYGLYDGDDY